MMSNPKFIASVAALIVGANSIVASGAAAATANSKVHSPESIQCSQQADTKNLHGKERQKFRAECKKELKAKSAAAPTKPAAAQ
ncbi:PsiF family protein [Hyphomicrobium sp.]|uniref:PsiF family protein n=1 Tax=Hyphomicrobium sp. TaxID=82 RepID=UPI003F6FEECE